MNMVMNTKIEQMIESYNQPRFVLLIVAERWNGCMVSIGSGNGLMVQRH